MKFGLYILKRLLLSIPVLLGITVITFVMLQVAPGGPVEQLLNEMKFGSESRTSSRISTAGGGSVSVEVIKLMNEQYGFDKPLWKRYMIWLNRIVHLDFGRSFVSGEPVLHTILSRFPVSLQFGFISLIVTTLGSILLGIVMAQKKEKIFDSLSQLALLAMSSMPSFVLALLLLVFFRERSIL